MPIRQRLAGLLDRAGVTEGLLRLRGRVRAPWLTVLTYHSVRDPAALPGFDPGTVDATPEAFDRQLALLVRHFTPVTLADVRAFLGGAALPPNPVLVTFDDGYRDNLEQGLPILRRHGVRAVFFVATGYVAERRVFWWDRAAWLLHHSRRPSLTLGYPTPLVVALDGDRRPALRKVLRIVKDHFGLDLERFLGELAQAAEVPWDRQLERRLADALVLSWAELRALRDAGMDVASHTRTHRVLQTVPPGELEEELAGSRADLERELGQPVFAISYPVGRGVRDTPQVHEAVARAGYQLGFSYASGVNYLWRRPDPLDLRRLAVEIDYPESVFRGILALPQLRP